MNVVIQFDPNTGKYIKITPAPGAHQIINNWITQGGKTNAIGLLTASGVTEYPVPTRHADPFGITTSDGLIWFTERSLSIRRLRVIRSLGELYLTVYAELAIQKAPYTQHSQNTAQTKLAHL